LLCRNGNQGDKSYDEQYYLFHAVIFSKRSVNTKLTISEGN